ncbi:MAG: GGDEF domain-containing protein [Clostridia bacterium]|nr:GGDEF domain-containing protein [Clostridia bacterium]
MYYSLVGILALIILFISNHDVLFRKRSSLTKVLTSYRNFLITVAIFYVSDVLWGYFWVKLMRAPLFIDTELFFIAMALGIMFLTRYAADYLEDKSAFRAILLVSGRAFCYGVVLVTLINLFYPIMFYIDEECGYFPRIARYITLGFQIVMLLLTSVYAFYGAAKTRDNAGRRYLTIGMFGVVMLLSITIQMFFPLLPLYSIGYTLECSLLRTFIIENERKEYRESLEKALCREQEQSQELKTAWKLAYTDALTGVKSKLAYIERETQTDAAIENGTLSGLALVVFDLNDLKRINDTLGHETGDKYITDGCALILEYFKNSPLYRTGGDEFIAILEGEDYVNRAGIFAAFSNHAVKNIADGGVVIACGIAEYIRGKDTNCKQILERADQLMYERKELLKKLSIASGD